MLLMQTLIAYQQLSGDRHHETLLREQVMDMVRELDASPFGLLDDYPGQCFPSDVIAAIAAIQRADLLLGMDHSAFIRRSLRGFQGARLDATGLPPYTASSRTGNIGSARGCTSQWATMWSAEIWPQTDWYTNFDRHFWQARFGVRGFREFPHGSTRPSWYWDVDSGPVLGGFGVAASAFGIGAARVNGRFDHAYALQTEAIAVIWPLPDGTLLLPRLLSNLSHAPYIAEAGLLFNFTRMPPNGVVTREAGSIPPVVYIIISLMLLCGSLLLVAQGRKLFRS